MTTDASRTPDTTWIPDTGTFGARLALVRWRMGWNLKEAERECGITQNLWSNWEAGSMPRDYIEAVAKIVWRTRVDRMWLMTGEGSPEPEDDSKDYGAVVTDMFTGLTLDPAS